ncbi:MAG: hypothetical protein LBU91_02575, partial [Bacteroidales bacterium]|nr:hypothetical protein [Bacteroidales bacterium]
MKKIAKINLEHLQNEEWYTYVNTLFQLINEHSAAKDFLMPMLGLLEKSYNDANASLEVIRGSQLSKEID